MGRSRDKNSEENLRGHLRQLRSENKHLRRTVARLEKQLARQPIESIEEDVIIEDSPTELAVEGCPKCGKELISIDLGIKTVLSCKSCMHRFSLKE